MSQATTNNVRGEIKTTPYLIAVSRLGVGSVYPTQDNYLTYETAPRNTETVPPQLAGHPSNNLSYKHPINTYTGNATYTRDEINPMRNNLSRPAANPYFLFMGKFTSQAVQNTDPVRVGHLDESNPASGVWQQPSNIYNIPDNPKDYVLIKNVAPSSGTNNINNYPDGNYDDVPSGFSSSTHVIYDANSCPVNWRMYEPIRSKVTDWSNNGVPANYVNFKAGRYVLASGASTFSNSTNPATRNVGGVYFNENQFDVSYNPTSQPNAYFELKPSFVSSLGSTGSGGTGTDLSFNNFFFKQPEMLLDCSAVFQSGGGSAGRDRLYISWDLPFHRKTGLHVKQEGKRYFYEDGENENWLPHFSELIFDISGGQNNRKFCQDVCGNLLHTGGASGYSSKPFAILSANNRHISLEATSSGTLSNSITSQYTSTGSFNHGTNGQTTIIVDNFTASPTSGNYAGGSPLSGDIGLGNLYDFALYYRNESKLNNPPGLASTDLYYNKHNPCIIRNIVFGVPGFISAPSSLSFFQSTTGSGERYYLGGSGPTNKDVKSGTPVIGLNLAWDNTAIIKVGYDCSLNFTRNESSTTRVQVRGINGNTSIMQDYSVSTGAFYDVSYNIFPDPANMRMISAGTNSPGTLRHWPSGGNGNTASWNVPDSNFDFIKLIDEIGNVPPAYSGSHPEHKYVVKNYHAVNDTENSSGNLQRAFRTDPSPLESLIVPIFTRSVCNTTGAIAYENVMSAAVGTWSPTIEFVDESTSTPTVTTASTSSVRRRIGGDTENVYFISGKNKLSFTAATSVNPYRQLANFGSAKLAPTARTGVNDLIDTNAYIGTTAKNTKIGQVDFVINQKPDSGSKSALGTTTIDIYGWENSENLINANNPSGGKLSQDSNYELELGTGEVFDIAKNETGFTSGYSNKKGYYLGFDISSCKCMIDLSNNYMDTALLGRSSTGTINSGYDKYELELEHTVEKRGTTSSSTKKSLQFHVGEDISRNITVTNISKGTLDIAKAGLKPFFGIRRLPEASIANGLYKGVTSTYSHLEMHLKFRLNNVSKRWMPPNTSAYGNDTLVELQFCVDPDGSSSIDLNENPGSVSGNTFEVKWSDNHVKSDTTPSSSIFFENTSGSAIGQTADEEDVPFFVELTEGQQGIVGANGNGDGHYSRSVTDPGRTLLGLKDIDSSTSVGHIKFANNFKSNPSTWAFNHRDITSTVDGDVGLGTGGNEYLFGTGTGKALFWDYTFQTDTDNGKLPSKIIGTGSTKQFHTDLLLQNTSKTSTLIPNEHVLASSYSSLPSNYIFGSTNFELLNLEAILRNNSSISTLYDNGKNYIHSHQLNNYQCMWCNGAFRGPVSSASASATSINNPYINYNTSYYEQDYTYDSLRTTGLILNGGSFVIHTDTNSSGGAAKPSGTPNSFTASGNYKVILLRINQGTSNLSKFNLKLFNASNNVMEMKNSGSDYFLFYSEYHSSDSSAYGVRYAAGTGTTGIRTSAFSGWLQPFTNGGFSTNTIKTIEYSSSLATGTRGSESGCAEPGVTWSVQKTNPSIKCFNIGPSVSKFVAIYIPEDKNIHRIELNKST